VKIVADENIDQQIVDRLRSDGHEVLSIADLDPGIDDDAVLLKSRESNSVLVTADKDFGELIFRQHLLHSGVMLIRLSGLKPEWKAELVALAFAKHADELSQGFAVLSRRALRLRKPFSQPGG
jgi:predicted nuclease of predicted toxin-antitoxin system